LATSFYDVVVLGGDLAATVAGAVLAHRGFRVLAAGLPVEERYTLGPYVLPRAPLAFVGLESPALKRVVAELNLVQLLRRRLEPNRPAYQLILPDHRIDVGDDVPREIARERPDAVAELDALIARIAETSTALESILAQDLILPPEGFWDRRDANRVGARLPDDDVDLGAPLPADHPLRAMLRLPAAFAGDLAQPGAVACARLADLHRRGTFRLDGGREGLRTLLLERLKTHSGEVRPELQAQAIAVKRGRITGVVFAGKEGTVGCGHVICGMGSDRVAALVERGGEKPPRRLADAAAIRPAAHRYLLHLVAPLDALPDALARFAFALADPSAPLDGGNALALHLADGYGQHAVLSVEALVKDTSLEALARVRARVRAHLDAIFPFVDRHLLVVHSPHDGVAAERADGVTAPPPAPMDRVWDIGGDRSLGVGGVAHGTGIKNLLLASRQVLPGLGVEGELAAGWGAARLVLAKERKRDLVKGAVLEG
jgi:phytoene dehydrogenase-like protein